MSDKPQRPLATEVMENHVRNVFPIDMDPEIFAARDGYGWLNFTFNDYNYRDAELDAWIHKVGSIIRDPEQLAACQRKHLNPAELAAMRKYAEDDLEEEDE
jgi:hypothetical protein